MKIRIHSHIVIRASESPGLFAGLLPQQEQKFRKWVPPNIHVVDAFLKYAKELKHLGRKKQYSAYAIRERLRWESMVSDEAIEYKISNDMTPFLARLIVQLDPELEGMFGFKSSLAPKWDY